jgi:C1A family cysteine protease
VFKDNLNYVHHHNQGKHSYTVAINHFADMNTKEFAAYNGLRNIPVVSSTEQKHGVPFNASEHGAMKPMTSLDWRINVDPIVSSVKNQGQCGSDWAFAAVGAVEGWAGRTFHTAHDLSAQQLVDCSGGYGTNGCAGGFIEDALDYVIANGLATSSAYPYVAYDQQCDSFSVDVQPGYYQSNTGESNLVTMVNYAPVAIEVESDQECFQFYDEGVLDDTACGTTPDHGVLVVGYTDDYWIVKNSWSDTWGLDGYIQIGRGYNYCGIANGNARLVKTSPPP